MHQSLERLRTAVSGLTLIAFALPFLTISCAGAEIPLSGFDLALGKTLEGSAMLGSGDAPSVIDGQPTVLAAVVCAGLALLASFSSSRSAILRLVRYASSLVGVLMLVLLRFGSVTDVPADARGMITISYSSGYWLTLLGFMAMFVLVRTYELQESPATPVGREVPRHRPDTERESIHREPAVPAGVHADA